MGRRLTNYVGTSYSLSSPQPLLPFHLLTLPIFVRHLGFEPQHILKFCIAVREFYVMNLGYRPIYSIISSHEYRVTLDTMPIQVSVFTQHIVMSMVLGLNSTVTTQPFADATKSIEHLIMLPLLTDGVQYTIHPWAIFKEKPCRRIGDGRMICFGKFSVPSLCG